MATVATQAAVIFFFILFSAELGTCLQCFSCSSGPDDICDDTFSYHARRTVRIVNCENSPAIDIPGAGLNTHCGKTKKANLDPRAPNDYAFRGCVPENYCKLVKSEVKECQICDDILCNSSSLAIPSYVLVIGIFSLLLIKMNFLAY